MKVILEGVVGSVAYGLNTPQSDIDIKGIFVYPTEKILSLHKGKETINKNNPDIEHHEVEKFIRLAINCNPTILELLFLEKYEILTSEGKMLVENRDSFLSKKIYKAYGGYALSQAKKLLKKSNTFRRYKKHARHCFRLLQQGQQLLESHNLTIKVSNREELLAIGDITPDELYFKFEKEFKKFDTINTTLPNNPDYSKINELLLKIRKMNYGKV